MESDYYIIREKYIMGRYPNWLKEAVCKTVT